MSIQEFLNLHGIEGSSIAIREYVRLYGGKDPIFDRVLCNLAIDIEKLLQEQGRKQ